MPVALGRQLEPRGRTFPKYVSMSFLASVILVYHAVIKHEQFYPAMEYLSTSKISLAILGNLGFASALVLYHVITFVFLGTLRDYETERVQDRVGQAIVETLLAMTIFRQNVESFGLLSRFVLLAFMKIFHWLAQDRVDFIETTQHVTLLQHSRLMSMILWLIICDLIGLHMSLVNTFAHGVSVHLLFAFEYSMQVSVAVAVMLKYLFSLVDMGIWNGSWRGKSVAVFYVDLTRDLVHLITYSAFFFVVFSTYGIPIHLIRDIYWTFRNFQSRVRDFLRYRQIAANMENRFPDATEEDLERSDHLCIVCREEMLSSMRAKRLPCNHVFHLDCLKSWLERQQNCPICRSAIPARDEAVLNQPGAAGAVRPPENNPEEHPIPGNEQQGDTTEERIENAADHIVEHEDSAVARENDAREAFLRRLEGHQETTAGPVEGVEEEAVDDDDGDDIVAGQEIVSENHHDNDDTQSAQPSIPRPPGVTEQERQRDVASPSREHYQPSMTPDNEDHEQQQQQQQQDGEEEEDIGETLRSMARRELDMEPTDEQHAQALAIAKAAAHAATLAAYATFPRHDHSSS